VSDSILQLALPKGHMFDGVAALLAEAGIPLRHSPRGYRPTVGLAGVEAKILKPQNVVEMLHAGSRDVGFAGADWVAELGASCVEVLDLGLDPVKLVAAAPRDMLVDGALPARPLVVASEYAHITKRWIAAQGLDAQFVQSYGATEVFPPEDADCIVDNTATGSTLRANGLAIVDTLMHSSTRLYASPRALEDTTRRGRIEDLALLLRSVVVARSRVMVEVNIDADRLARLVGVLPCMREPTVSPLAGGSGYAVKAAVPRSELPAVILQLKALGGTDLVVTSPSQIVP